MITTFPTFEKSARALEQGMLSVDPSLVMSEDDLSHFAEDTGLDGVFLAGALSMCVTHERTCVTAFRALRSATANPMLKGEYERLEKETVVAVDAYEKAIAELGGDPLYVSPAARLTEAIDTKIAEALLLTGSADPMTIDAKTVSIAGLGAMTCVMNVETLKSFVAESEDGPSRSVLQALLDAVGPASQQHHEWAMRTHVELATTSAKHKTTATLMNKAENLMTKVEKKISRP